MSRKRKRSSPFRLIVLVVLVAGALYINRVVVPATPPLFIPTATPTRSPESFLNEASSLIQNGKINQAIETYKQAVKADPRNPAVYVTLARWQVLYGDYAGAMENVQNALLLNSSHALAHAVHGWIIGKQGDYLQGTSEIKDSLDLDPNSALAYAYLAEIYKDMIDAGKEELNTRDLAGQYSRKAVELDGSLLEVRRARGLVLEATGNYDEAIKEFEAAVAMNDNLADLHMALGRNYKALNAYDKAAAELNRAITLRPEDPEPYAELARTYLTMGDYAKGVQLAEQAVQRNPKDPLLHSLLGTLNYKKRDYNVALKDLRLAVNGGTYVLEDGSQVQVESIPLDQSLTATNLYSRYGLALAYLGQCGEALQVSQKIGEIVPDNQDAMYNAQVMIDTCKQQADKPASQSTATPTAKPNQ
jgi:tetratricopeptide (TPR) repeat protein